MKTLSSLSRLVASFAIALSLYPVANAQTGTNSQPVILVDGVTPGYYNNSLGTILDGTAPQFPSPLGSGGGDPLIYPSAEPDIAAAANILGNWLTPHSTLNANWFLLPAIPAAWPGDTETAIIYEINGGTHGFTNLVGNFDADNGLFVWVNGQFKFGARGPGLPSPEGQYEYTNVFLGHLNPGTNRIQILREDNYDATGYRVRIMGVPLGGTPLPTCAPGSSSLIGWWRAEGGGADSAGTNTGILLGGAGIAAGKVGQAFTFDGVDDSVRIPVAGPFTILDVGINNGFTVEAWVNPSRLTIGPIVEWNNGAGGEGAHFWHSVDSITAGDGPGNLYANIVDTSGVSHQLVSASGLLATNTYSHVALTYDKNTGVAVIYVNGMPVRTQNLGIFTPQTSYDFHIGRRASGFFSENLFKGSIDEVSLYYSALTAAEIQAIAAAGSLGKCGGTNPPVVNCSPAASGLVSWWPGENLATDIAGGNNGSLLNGASFAAGRVGQAFSFDGTGGHMRVPDQINLRFTNAMSIETWVFPTANGGYRNIVTKWDGIAVGQRAYGLGLYPSGEAYWGVTPDGGDWPASNANSTNVIPLNTWTHLAATYDGDATRLYVNGVLQAQTAYNLGIFPGNNDLAIGGAVGGLSQGQVITPFAGLIDEPSLYNRALSDSEVSAIYNSGSAGKCPLPPAPVITQHPQDRTVNAPATAQFTVAATGSPPLRYQWFFAGNSLPGATNTSLFIPNAQPTNQGTYFVTVSNDFGFAISSNATLTVLTFPPVITRQPTNVTVIESMAASFSVQATGSVTLAYQWLLNGAPLAGKTTTTLSFTTVQLSNAGNYSVIVTNPYGAVTSSVATLTVNPRPPCAPVHDGLVSWWRGESNALDGWDSNNGVELIFPRVGQYTAGKVGLAFFSTITVPDAPSLRFTNAMTIEAWVNPSSYFGPTSRPIVSKFDSSAFDLPTKGTQNAYQFGLLNDGALYFSISTNGSSLLTVRLATTNALPINQWSHVAATYDGTALRIYTNGVQVGQLSHAGGIFPGTANLTIGSLNGGLLDEVSLYNRALPAAEIQSIVAADITGKCLAPPVITLQPQDQTVPLGEDVKFTVGVSGSRPLTYQWFFNGSRPQDRIIGATNASLIIEKIRTNNVGVYLVAVTNSVGFVFSARVPLSTLPAPSCVDVLPGLISWWPGDTNTLDARGLNNIATYSPASYPTGKVASAFTFNGSQSRITVNNSASLNFGSPLLSSNSNFSIEMWIKAGASNRSQANVPLFEKRTTTTTWVGYSLSLNQGRLAFALGTSSIIAAPGVSSFVASGPDLRDAMFHHVAVTVSRSATNGGVLYVDGLPVLTFNPTTRIDSLDNTSPLYIGGPATTLSNSYFGGLIDEPAIYGRALTAAEILSIRTAGAAGRCKARPVIVTQPVGGSVALGSNFTMNVVASGTPLLRYQWRRNTAPLSGATNSTLTLSNVTLLSAGTYSVIVSNAFGSVTSTNAIVAVSNRPPTAVSGSFAVNEDFPIDVLLTGTDPEQNPLTYIIVTPPTNGILSGPATSRFRIYTPFQNYNGPDFFTYKVNDGFSDSPIATMSITVRPVNDAPVAFSEQFFMDEDTVLPIQLRADDVDDEKLTFAILQAPAHGVLSGSGPKRFYTPGTNYVGDDYFTFIALDASKTFSELAAVTITIRPINDAPVARIVITPLDQLPGETNTVLISPACCDTTLVLDGSQSSDVENTPLTYIWMDGSNVIATTATFTNQFSPGLHEFTLIVSDGELTGTETLTAEILKTEEAVLHLLSLVQDSALARNEKAALGNWLRVTMTALEHCNVDQAVMFLERFEARVAERISVINANDAELWKTTSKAIREVAGLCDPAHRPGGGNGNQETPKSKSEQESDSGGRGNSDEVRAGKSSPR